MEKDKVAEALKKLKGEAERNFDQTVDLIVNLKNYDQEDPVNFWVTLPNKVRDAKVCGFLESESGVIDTVKGSEFKKYDKKKAKNLTKNYDFFIASGKLMPKVGKTFGRYLGPSGKMPSPQHGLVRKESDDEIKKVVDRFDNIVRVKSAEPSVKIPVGKESYGEEEVAENALAAYERIVKELPNGKQNVKNVLVKLTMTKPIKLER